MKRAGEFVPLKKAMNRSGVSGFDRVENELFRLCRAAELRKGALSERGFAFTLDFFFVRTGAVGVYAVLSSDPVIRP